jgi:hypothetical protein
MKTLHRKTKPAKRPPTHHASPSQEPTTIEAPPAAESVEAPGRRAHGDSYSDIVSREDELVGASSSHLPQVNRRPEEPSEPTLDARERLEGNI